MMFLSKNVLRHLPLILIAMVALSQASAMPPANTTPDDNLQIERLPDGTSIISNIPDGYEFAIPSGWYPISFSPTEAELQDLNATIEKHQLPINLNILPAASEDEIFTPLLIGLELDPAHYENGNFMSIFVMAEVGLFPGAGLIPLSTLVGLSQNAEGIEDVYIIEKNDGEILVAEMAFDGIYAHIAIFMRHGKGILFGFATDVSEMQSLIADAFHATLDSFEFTETNNAQ